MPLTAPPRLTVDRTQRLSAPTRLLTIRRAARDRAHAQERPRGLQAQLSEADRPLTFDDIAAALARVDAGVSPERLHQLLARMVKRGELRRAARGCYAALEPCRHVPLRGRLMREVA